MAVSISKRANMVLFVNKNDINSHRIKIILAEKNVPVDIFDTNPDKLPEELLRLNPYGSLPTLIDRDLTLYEPSVISEYLDERFPHPPLLPVYPIARAKSRLMMLRIERDWYSLVKQIRSGAPLEAENARQRLTESLLSFTPVFANFPFFMSEEFSLLDCCISPLLWALPELKITLPPKTEAIQQYADRLFQRPSFKASLGRTERENEAA